MTINRDAKRWLPYRSRASMMFCATLALCACHEAPPSVGTKVAVDKDPGEGVSLSTEQVQRMGIVVRPAKSVDYIAETQGFGVIVVHETIATAVAELATAKAAERQSRAALTRSQRLAGTPGATSVELDEAAARQAAADLAALALAKQRLSTVLGSAAVVRPDGNDPMLRDLADGKIKLLRAVFPLGAFQVTAPSRLRASRLDSTEGAIGWTLKSVWNAPADINVPGRSFFALIKGVYVGEGERLLVWAPAAGPAVSGALVPAAAVVISASKYWCYTEHKPGVYVRVETDTRRPLADGYFVTDRIAVGDKVVTAGAGLLLAREMNSSSDAD